IFRLSRTHQRPKNSLSKRRSQVRALLAADRSSLMLEVTYSGKHHRHLPFIRSSNHVLIPDRATRLNRSRCPCFGGRNQSVGEREKCVAADRAPSERKSRLFCLPNSDPRRIHTSHLTRPNSKSSVLRGINDGIRFDMLYDPPTE